MSERNKRNDRKEWLRGHGAITGHNRLQLLDHGPLSPERDGVCIRDPKRAYDPIKVVEDLRELGFPWKSPDVHGFASEGGEL